MYDRRSGPGSSGASNFITQGVSAKRLAELRPAQLLPDYEVSLAERMRAGEALTTDQLTALKVGMSNALSELTLRSRPATEAEIAQVLIAFAEMLGCNEPGEAGLKLYLKVLGSVPAPALKEAEVELAANHRFKRMPNPAEILEAAKPYIRDIEDSRAWFRQWIGALEKKLPAQQQLT